MATRPRVSVIITTYNRAPLLVEAIESVLAQTYRDYELLVADDASTDDTAQRVRSYGDDVRYLALSHDGRPERARNRAIATARGDFFAFLDDDDLWDKEKLLRQMAVLEADERLGYVYSDYRFRYDDGSLSPPLLLPAHKQSHAVFDHLLEGCFVHPSTVVMRRSLFEQVGPFDERFICQGDYDLWLRAAHAAPVGCVPQPLASMRRHPSSLSQQWNLLNLEGAIQVLEGVRRQLPLTWRQRWRSRRALSRFHATLGLRHQTVAVARRELLHSLFLNPLQRTAWFALMKRFRPL